MPTYLERYLNGEHAQVCTELTALGKQVRTEPLARDAQAVAQEIMRRARHNIALLTDRLRLLNYRFEAEPPPQPNPHRAWTPPDAAFQSAIAAFDEEYGPLPLVLRTWYDVVGQVNFMGDHPRLSQYNHSEGPASDPLVLDYDPDSIEDQIEEDAENSQTGQRLYHFDLAPDACHKSNYSGGGPTCIKIPTPSFDAPLISDDEWDRMYLIPYLRICFQWGGFPGLRSQPAAAAAAATELSFLTQDLLPL